MKIESLHNNDVLLLLLLSTRLLLDAEGYKLEDLENCIKTLMPSLKKQLPLFPVELQHRIGHLTEEIDNLTAGILCADAIDRLVSISFYISYRII